MNPARASNINRNMSEYVPSETAIIILGDSGFNFWLNKTDKKYKKLSCAYGYTFYCVRGNHEERPENLGYVAEYDSNVNGAVYVDKDFPMIRYFIDGNIYTLNNHKCLVVGGAYSIDKWYRLKRVEGTKEHPGWFPDEQLTEAEMQEIMSNTAGKEFDFVFSHTCPISWAPEDLFLRGLDQSQIDKTMEIWMEKFKDMFKWNIWLLGHFHTDRLELPHVEIFYTKCENIEDIFNRWEKYDKTGELDWWLPRSPKFYITNGQKP